MARCSRCGQKTGWTPHEPSKIHAHCREWPSWWELGSWFALLISALGITKHRVKAVAKWLGIPCGCDGREEALNKAGWMIKNLADPLVQTLLIRLPR